MPARRTMIVGTLECQRSEDALKHLCTPACKACALAAGAQLVLWIAIGEVGVEALLNSTSGKAEHLPADSGFQSFQIQLLQGLPSKQRFDIPKNLSRQQAVERGFF